MTSTPMAPATVYSTTASTATARVMFEPGDTVRVRQNLDYRPNMVVKQAVKAPHETDPGRKVLIGILCFWYGPNGEYREMLHDTKDLELLDKGRKG